MNTKELESRIYLTPYLHGHFIVTINYRGKEYCCTLAYDAIKSGDTNYYTKKQALRSLWDECKQFNLLGI